MSQAWHTHNRSISYSKVGFNQVVIVCLQNWQAFVTVIWPGFQPCAQENHLKICELLDLQVTFCERAYKFVVVVVAIKQVSPVYVGEPVL